MAKTYVIDNNEARAPFFGDKMSFITGLDPLGLQNPSVKAYSNLLPGLNNVTGQIRCYSFYCWLLNEYSLKIKTVDPREQRKFIRKAEYIIALISQLGDIPGISGRQYASDRVEETDTFDLNVGTYNADGTTVNTYWQYYFGVFGQYYLGSMRQIGIIDEPIDENGNFLGVFRRTSSSSSVQVSGEDLSNAFEENVSKEGKELYLECIDRASITKEEIAQLTDDFNLREIKLNSREWELLTEMLLSVDSPVLMSDKPETMRKQTLRHVLKFAIEYPEKLSDRAFTMHAYDVKGMDNKVLDECLLGWYYYQQNEYWQVGCGAMLNGFILTLDSLVGPGWIRLLEIVNTCTDLIADKLKTDEDVDVHASFSFENIRINYAERDLYKLFIKGTKEEKLSYGFLMVLKLYKENVKNLQVLDGYAQKNDLSNPSDAIAFFSGLSTSKSYDLKTFIRTFLMDNIINRHQLVAYKKMGSGSQSTQKFIIEDGLIRQVGNFGPGFTGPRVGNLITYLKDLQMLSEENVVTHKGLGILENIEV